jgi:hypothetical protein
MRTIALTAVTALALTTAAGLIQTTGDSAKEVTSKTIAKASENAEAAIWRQGRDTCRKAVLAQLKAPSTARWAGDDEQYMDGSAPYIAGHVDAQNGFGAMMRLSYTCREGGDDSIDALVTEP